MGGEGVQPNYLRSYWCSRASYLRRYCCFLPGMGAGQGGRRGRWEVVVGLGVVPALAWAGAAVVLSWVAGEGVVVARGPPGLV